MSISLDKFFGAANLLKAVELLRYLAQDRLLVSHRTGESKRPKSGFVDYVWLKIAEQLGSIGISKSLLQKIKNEIFQEVNTEEIYQLIKETKGIIDELPNGEQKNQLISYLDSGLTPKKSICISLLQLLICETIFDRVPVSLIIFTNGNWLPWYEDRPDAYSDQDRHSMAYHTHVTVSITEIIEEFLYSDQSTFILPKLYKLSSSEQKLLNIIHSGAYESITIHFKEQKMKSLEMVKAQPVKRRIADILSENGYQEIVIKSHQGMVSTIKNTVKMKLS